MANLRDLIGLAVKQIIKDLNNQPSPKVRYESHNKKISVTHDFRIGTIPKVKIIASREQWFEIYHGINEQSFASIQELLYPKEKKKELKRYAEEELERFLNDLLIYAAAAHTINPIQYFKNGEYYLYKKRKSSHHGLSPHCKYKVASMAGRLYVYLRYLSKTPQKQWHPYVKPFLEKYKISISEIGIGKIKKDIPNIVLMDRVKVVMSKYYGIDFNDRFWQTFFVESPIKLKRITRLKRINPEEDPFLKQLFREFMD